MRKIDPAIDLTGHFKTFEQLPNPWDAATLFGRTAPLEVEVGSGKGLFLRSAAAARPEVDFLGIEVARKYAEFTAAALAKARGFWRHARPVPAILCLAAAVALFVHSDRPAAPSVAASFVPADAPNSPIGVAVGGSVHNYLLAPAPGLAPAAVSGLTNVFAGETRLGVR